MSAKTNRATKKAATPLVKAGKALAKKRSKPAYQKPKAVNRKKSGLAGAKKSSRHAEKKVKKPVDKTNENSSKEKLSVVTPSGRKEQSFFQLVYEVARQIPKGRVTSYGAIAACLGTKLSARMVGWAMNGAHNIHPKIPAHRVVNRNGMLSGKNHFETPDKMKELLEKEGTAVVDDTVVNFKEKFWDPASEF
jgi:methylated-DNA-protein-cysteine methyltransferase-like protein